MENRGNKSVTATKNLTKQGHQNRERSRGSVHKAVSQEEELANQLAKIERELRRKERKLEKYNRVLTAKTHVRDTVRQHNAATHGQESPKTSSPAQNSPQRAVIASTSRSVTFSTQSPDVKYVATRCESPAFKDRGSLPPATHPQGRDKDKENAHKIPSESSLPTKSNTISEKGSVGKAQPRNEVSTSLGEPRTDRHHEVPMGFKDTGTPQGATDVMSCELGNEELNLCVQAMIEDADCMVFETDCGEGTMSVLPHASPSGHLGQTHQAKEANSITDHLPANSALIPEPIESYKECWSELPSHPSLPIQDPPTPSNDAKLDCSPTKSLPCNQMALRTESPGRHCDKGVNMSPGFLSFTPSTAAPAGGTLTSHPKELKLVKEKLNSQFPPEADFLKRNCMSQHSRWRSRVSHNDTQSTGSNSSSSSSRRGKLGSCESLLREDNNQEDIKGVKETVQKITLGEEIKPTTTTTTDIHETALKCNKPVTVSKNHGEGSDIRFDRAVTRATNTAEMGGSAQSVGEAGPEGRRNTDRSQIKHRNDIKDERRVLGENTKKDMKVQLKEMESSLQNTPYCRDTMSFCHQASEKTRNESCSSGDSAARQLKVKKTPEDDGRFNDPLSDKTCLQDTRTRRLYDPLCKTPDCEERKTLMTLGMDVFANRKDGMETDDSRSPSVKIEGSNRTEVEPWTLPFKEDNGVLLTTAITTVDARCVLLRVQECGLQLWRAALTGGEWTLAAETQHTLKNTAGIRDIQVEGLPSWEEARFLMVVQREGEEEEEEVEVIYVQYGVCGGEWQLSSAPVTPPASGSFTLSTCVLGEWSVAICWSPVFPSSKDTLLTLLDFDVAYSRRGKKWELVCHPCTKPLPGSLQGGGGGGVCITSLLTESGPSGLVVWWSTGTLTLYDPWKNTVIASVPSPTTGLLWALAVEKVMFVLGQQPGHPHITLTAINPLTGLSDPFLTFPVNKGQPGIPPAALLEGGSPWRMTGVCLHSHRFTLAFSGGRGVHLHLKDHG